MHNDKLITLLLEEYADAFDKAFVKKAFVHWYAKTGMEEGIFVEAREFLASKINDWRWEGENEYGAEEQEE